MPGGESKHSNQHQNDVVIEVSDGIANAELPEFHSARRDPSLFVFGEGENQGLLAMIAADVRNGHAYFTTGVWLEEPIHEPPKKTDEEKVEPTEPDDGRDRFRPGSWDSLKKILQNPILSPDNIQQVTAQFQADMEACRLGPNLPPPWLQPRFVELQQFWKSNSGQLADILSSAYLEGQRRRKQKGLSPSRIIRSGHALNDGLGAIHLLLTQAIVDAGIQLQQAYSPEVTRMFRQYEFYQRRLGLEKSVQIHINQHRQLPIDVMEKLQSVLQDYPQSAVDDRGVIQALLPGVLERLSMESCLSIYYFFHSVVPGMKEKSTDEKRPSEQVNRQNAIKWVKENRPDLKVNSQAWEDLVNQHVSTLDSLKKRSLEQHPPSQSAEPNKPAIDPMAKNPKLLLYLIQHFPLMDAIQKVASLSTESKPRRLEDWVSIIQERPDLMRIIRQQVNHLKQFFLHVSRRVFHLPGEINDISLLFDMLPKDSNRCYKVYEYTSSNELFLVLVTGGPDGEKLEILQRSNVYGISVEEKGRRIELFRADRDQKNNELDSNLVDDRESGVNNGRGTQRTPGCLTIACRKRLQQMRPDYERFFRTLFLALPVGLSEQTIAHVPSDDFTQQISEPATVLQKWLGCKYVNRVLPTVLSHVAPAKLEVFLIQMRQECLKLIQEITQEPMEETGCDFLQSVSDNFISRVSVLLLGLVGREMHAKLNQRLVDVFGSTIRQEKEGNLEGARNLAVFISRISTGVKGDGYVNDMMAALSQTLSSHHHDAVSKAFQSVFGSLYLTYVILPNVYQACRLFLQLKTKESDTSVKLLADTLSMLLPEESNVEHNHVALAFIQLLAGLVNDDEWDEHKERVRKEAYAQDPSLVKITELLRLEQENKAIKSVNVLLEKAMICIDLHVKGGEKIKNLSASLSRMRDGSIDSEKEPDKRIILMAGCYSGRDGVNLTQLLGQAKADESQLKHLFGFCFPQVFTNLIKMAFHFVANSFQTEFLGREYPQMVKILAAVIQDLNIEVSDWLEHAKMDWDKLAAFRADQPDPEGDLEKQYTRCQVAQATNHAFQTALCDGEVVIIPEESTDFVATEMGLPWSLQALHKNRLIPAIDSDPNQVFSLLADKLMDACLQPDLSFSGTIGALTASSKQLMDTYNQSQSQNKQAIERLVDNLASQVKQFLQQLSVGRDQSALIQELASVALYYFDRLNPRDILKRVIHASYASQCMRLDDSRFIALASLTELMTPLWCLSPPVLQKMPEALQFYFHRQPDSDRRDRSQQLELARELYKAQSPSLHQPKTVEMIFALLAEPVALLCLFDQAVVLILAFGGDDAYEAMRGVLFQLGTWVACSVLVWTLHFLAEMDRIPGLHDKLSDRAKAGLSKLKQAMPTLSGVSSQLAFNFLFKIFAFGEFVDWGLHFLILAMGLASPCEAPEVNTSTTTTPLTTPALTNPTTTGTTADDSGFSWSIITWFYFGFALIGVAWRILDVAFLRRFPGLAANVGNKPAEGVMADFELEVRYNVAQRQQVHGYRMVDIHGFKLIAAIVSVNLLFTKWGIGCNNEIRAAIALAFGVVSLALNLLAFPCYKPGLTAEGTCCNSLVQHQLRAVSETPWVQRITVGYNLIISLFALLYFIQSAVRNLLVVNADIDADDVSIEEGPYQATMIVCLVIGAALLLIDRFVGLGASPFAAETDRARRPREQAQGEWRRLHSILSRTSGARAVVPGHVQKQPPPSQSLIE